MNSCEPIIVSFERGKMEKDLFKKKYFTMAPSQQIKVDKYDPISWNEYYDEKEDILIDQNVFSK